MTLRAIPMLLAPLLVALALPASGQSSPPSTPFVSETLARMVYGVYCAQQPERVEAAPETASGTINIVPSIPDFRFLQTRVPAQIGIGFGVLAWAPSGDLLSPVTVTVTHPPYAESGITTERWLTDIDEGPNLMGFSFDSPGELVLGEWTFSAATLDGEELFFISFEVVAPERMPHIISACLGSFLS